MRTIIITLLSIIFIGINFVGNSFAGEVLDNMRKTNKMILCAGPYAWPTSANYQEVLI